MPKYVLDPIVEDELWGIWRFISQDNPDAATRVIEAAYKTFDTLAANPGLGKPRKFRNSRLLGIRSFRVSGFESYLIFYRSIPGARDLESLFDGPG
jgi:plasmid stabilization system protein ParE